MAREPGKEKNPVIDIMFKTAVPVLKGKLQEVDTVFAPGLKLVDENALKIARQSGWFYSFQLQEHLDDRLYLDWIPAGAVDHVLNRLGNGLLKLYANEHNLMINIDPEKRKKIAEKVYLSLCNGAAETLQ